MGQQFDRVAIALTPGGTEYVVLESQLLIDFGQGQGPQGGVVTVKDGWVTIQGAGEARLDGGQEEQGGTFPPRLTLKGKALKGKGKLAVEIAAHEDPTGNPSKATLYLEGASAKMRMRDANGNDHTLLDGAAGNLWLGGKAASGDVVLFKKGETDNRNTAKATIHLDGDAGRITLGANGKEVIRLSGSDGVIAIKSDNGSDGVVLSSSLGNVLILGTQGSPGNLFVRDDAGKDTISLGGQNGEIWVRGILVQDSAGNERIRLDGSTGDIRLQGADCAEEFDVVEFEAIDPGTVLVIDGDVKLRPCKKSYDKKVAGVVSGGNGSNPGIVLDQNPGQNKRLPIALNGKTYCKVDAQYSSIEVGDLLTTSPTPGHAMKAGDPLKALGAVIGKALRRHDEGKGLIPILVALQ